MDRQTFADRYLTGLTAQQREAVCAVNGPVLLLAVPGSGKTTVLVHRLGYMLHCCGIRPREILTVTYTRAAAADMRRRFESLFPEFREAGLRFATINALAVEIIGEYTRNHSKKPPFETADRSVTAPLLRSAYQAMTEEFLTMGTLRELETQISFVKNMMYSDRQIQEYETDLPDFYNVYTDYQQALVRNRQMDYDDQLVYAQRILASRPAVLAHFRERYRYFCVDEAQDTSLLQHTILRQLAGETRNLFMVGDEDQSIYGFRAAYPQALTEFEEVYPEGKTLYIEQNFRSTPEIVDAANRFVEKNLFRHPKRLVSTGKTGQAVEIITVPGQREEILFLRQVVRTAQEKTAILYRNNESSIPVLDYLERERIPYHHPSADNTFFSGRVTTDVVNLLLFAGNQSDPERFLTIYSRLPLFLRREQAKYLCAVRERTGKRMLDILAEEEPSSERRAQVKRCIQALEQINEVSAETALSLLCNELGYLRYLGKTGGESTLSALGWIARAEPSAERLVQRIGELETALKTHINQPDSRVFLSTIHSSKGLEYDQVYLLDIADGILPAQNPEDDIRVPFTQGYQEERRLFYVAMTRARLGLHLFFRMDRSSTFVEEVNGCLPREKGLPRRLLGEEYVHDILGRVRILARGKGRYLLSDRQGTAKIVKEDGLLRDVQGKKRGKPLRSVSTLLGRAAKQKKDSLTLKEGDRVRHQKFGPGTVVQAEGDLLSIRFGDGSTRHFSKLILESISGFEKLT